MPIAITDEQLARQASPRAWARRAGTPTLVRTTQILPSVVAGRALGLPRET
ncbi:MAG TPA: hypothetical protein VEC76_15630 [Streptosporangiaceae bacterium]|nr:hypothetical protein [Streptosporangiaceae bacterium]